MMDLKPILALPKGFLLVGMEKSDEILTFTVVSTQRFPCCPLCGIASTRVHSFYTRQVADLPCAGQSIRLLIQVSKYLCEECTCPRKIFAERLTSFIEPFARVTKRLYQIVQIIGLATGGRLGVRVTDRLGIQTSRQTILRRIMALPTEPVGQISQVGIDDFSFRRGRKFGTIIVDLQTHKMLDVLPDRTAETAAAWMATHPEIELVSRDRGGDYASAVATGAAQAVQCADRFHILKNLGEAVEGCVARHLAAKRKTHPQDLVEDHLPIEQVPRAVRRSPKAERLQQAYREERLARYEQVIALRKLGMSQEVIAERVGISSSTGSLWLAAGVYPETTRGPYVSRIDPYLPYLFQRWESGGHNMVRLHQELVAQGYKGSYASVRDHLVRQLPGGKKNVCKGVQLSPIPPPVRHVMFLFLRRPEDLNEEERGTILQLRQSHPELDLASTLVHEFAKMLRTRTGENLDAWLAKAVASQIPEFQSFVLGIERDKAAVQAGLTRPENNGIVEGKVNKLKLIKRMGYGRAAFPLLRQRVLHAL
jgi:transposase